MAISLDLSADCNNANSNKVNNEISKINKMLLFIWERRLIKRTSAFIKSNCSEIRTILRISGNLNELAKDNNSILIHENNLQAVKSKIGDDFVWSCHDAVYCDDSPEYRVTFTVRGTYKMWPGLLLEQNLNPRTELFGVISLNTLNAIRAKIPFEFPFDFLQDERLILYIKPESSLNQTQFKEELLKLPEILSIVLISEEFERMLSKRV